MSARSPQDIIKRPYITERTTQQRGEANRYAFVVDPRANKIEIKAAIETLYKVKVSAVHVMNKQGKKKRIGWRTGRTPNWKKALVTLVPPGRIEVFEGT
jgi:large subunit ribosomal protein L23